MVSSPSLDSKLETVLTGVQHILSLPALQLLRTYHAHSASITSISISPPPPPLPASGSLPTDDHPVQSKSPEGSLRSFGQLRGEKSRSDPRVVPVTPPNSIYVATSSIDGNVCVASLTDPKDILLRNFGRPVQAVALSPAYKSDRTYLSGGRAGQLVLTVGGRVGVSSNSTTMGGATATASSWLGSIGLGQNTGKDTILHSGEGAINTIKWSLSGKFVAWINEEGIKVMRSHLHLESSDSEFAWTRISHVDRPNRPGWEEMAAVWKARAEWVDESSLESSLQPGGPQTSSIAQHVEKLVVGWGSTAWVINVFPDRLTPGRSARDRRLGCAEVVTMFVPSIHFVKPC
jgi:vacuolar protein sorting-associated protein 41